MAEVELISREQNIARMRVSLDVKEVDSAFNQAYKEIGKGMNLPGFRKGKIPPNVIRQRIGADAIAEEVGDSLRDYALRKGLADLKLTARSGRTEWHSAEPPVQGQAVSYELSQPVLPEVGLPDLEAITINVTRLPLTDEMKQRFTDRLLDRFSEATPREDGAVDGDIVVIGVHSHFAENGEHAPFGGHDIMFSPGREGNLPGWDEKLRGAKVGEKLEFDYDMPADYNEPAVAGKTLKIEIHVDAVEAVKRPEFNEEFIKDKLQLESMEKYEEYRSAILEREIDSQLRQQIRDEAARRLSDGVSAEITDDMLSEEIDGMLKEHDRILREHGSNLESFLKDKSQTITEYRESLKENAGGKIRFFLGVNALTEKHDLHATTQDLNRYAYYLMQQEGISAEHMKKLLREPEFINEAAYQILRDKAMEVLLSTISINVDGKRINAPENAAEIEAELAAMEAQEESAEDVYPATQEGDQAMVADILAEDAAADLVEEVMDEASESPSAPQTP